MDLHTSRSCHDPANREGGVTARPYSPETLAERWGCSEGLVYKLIRDGRLQCFRPGSLIRISAGEVERFECQTTASSDCGEGSPLSSNGWTTTASPKQRRQFTAPCIFRLQSI